MELLLLLLPSLLPLLLALLPLLLPLTLLLALPARRRHLRVCSACVFDAVKHGVVRAAHGCVPVCMHMSKTPGWPPFAQP